MEFKLKRIKLTGLIVFLFLISTLAACSGGKETGGSSKSGDTDSGKSGNSKSITIRMAGAQAPENPMYKAAMSFVEEVGKNSNGKIKGEAHFGGVLGGERETAEAVQLGNIEMGWISDIGLSTVVPEIGFAFLPYLVTNYDELETKYYNGWIGEEVTKRLAAKNLQVLGFMDNDARWLSNSDKPIKNPEDLKNMTIRVPEIPELVQFFKELGALPTNMAITEVITALQQGTVDGQDNGAILNYTMGFYEFQPYMTNTNHVFSGGAVVVNKEWWDSLSSEDQNMIGESVKKWVKEGNKGIRENVKNFTQKMKDSGVEITEPSEQLKKAMQKAGRKVWDNQKNYDRYGEEVMKKILE
ncbi:TRAP transporter substrate-binding protein [Bacillus sp. FJAT-29814]|uniref:TRAP transporter substrate-binding protein n=1 Tax=Bacillus sp. FJAT-29814 TaxID=1729688 RepID=UPI00082CF4D6|nr:TRAP transporter substrate-binding protein [Bacillus sp. FJAT-29814]